MSIMCPWDNSGKLVPGVTVRSWLEYLRFSGYSGNITIDRVYYKFPSLLICPPDNLDLSAVIIALDDGYYGNYGILTK